MKTATEAVAPRNADTEVQLRLKYGVEMDAVSLSMPGTLEDAEIIDVGKQVRMIHNASAWWVADFILFCQRSFLETRQARGHRREIYDRVQKLWPEYSRQTLKDFASIARRVPPKMRSPDLSFEHHSYIATLADEPNAAVLQAHYVKVARDTEATAEQLRLMIADTRNGMASAPAAKPRPMKTIKAEADGRETASSAPEPAAKGAEDDGLPISRQSEPSLLGGGHAALASDAQRACSRLREWYATQARKTKVESWTQERKSVLVHDLETLIKEMHAIVEIFQALTNAEQTGDY